MLTKNRMIGGSATAEWGKVLIGIVIIVLGATVIRTMPAAQQSPIPGIDFQWGRSVVMVGFVLAMFPVIRMYFLNPLKEAIDTRNNELERTFTEAEELRTSMDKLRKDYEQRLAATEASAKEQIQAQIREAQNLRQTLMAEATEKADLLLEQARESIEQEKAKALIDIRSAVVDLTMTATEKVIGQTMDDARNRKLVEDFIQQVEVAR